MHDLDNLPKRSISHEIENAAKTAFTVAIEKSNLFVIQYCDISDYGVDTVIEACDNGSMTNIRVQIQLKGTKTSTNSDGSVSISVALSNLNYLLTQPDSVYICYHIPSNHLLVCSVQEIFIRYAHKKTHTDTQESITVNFIEAFDESYQDAFHSRVVAAGKFSRDQRIEQIITPSEQLPKLVDSLIPTIEIPSEPKQAFNLLEELYAMGKDDIISKHFSLFEAVLHAFPHTMDKAYMAEVNLGINGFVFNEERVRKSILIFETTIENFPEAEASLLYCIGNSWLVLKEYNESIMNYLRAKEMLLDNGDKEIAAECLHNLGSAYEKINEITLARNYYEKSLILNPYLNQSHFSLGLILYRHDKNYAGALVHIDSWAPLKTQKNSLPSKAMMQ